MHLKNNWKQPLSYLGLFAKYRKPNREDIIAREWT